MDMFFFLRKWFFKPHDVTFFKLLRALPLDSHLALISEMTYNVSSGTLNTTIPIPTGALLLDPTEKENSDFKPGQMEPA